MKYEFGLRDECFCYRCHKMIQIGEYKLRVVLYFEKVVDGELVAEILKTTQIPSLCVSCAQGVLKETEVPENVFILPRVDKPILLFSAS